MDPNMTAEASEWWDDVRQEAERAYIEDITDALLDFLGLADEQTLLSARQFCLILAHVLRDDPDESLIRRLEV
jgi:hypothetical protein